MRLKNGERRRIEWDILINDIIENCEQYHKQFYDINNFDGPSYYFHIRALNANTKDKSEMTYALLVSWGMHRMGGGPKMNDFETFNKSISECDDKFILLNGKKLSTIVTQDFNILLEIFDHLNPMRSSRKIVGASKVMAHYLPEIIVPIDNEYTFKFITGKKYMPRNWDEKNLFNEIHLNLFKPIISNIKFNTLAANWLKNEKFQWDTSLPKIIDNLIIGKLARNKKTPIPRETTANSV